MKIKLVLFISLLPSSIIFSQTYFEFDAGYVSMNFKDVNNDLMDSYNALSSAGIYAYEPEELKGGLYFDGALTFQKNALQLGLSGNYITGEGELLYSDFSGSFEESYSVNTIELLGFLGTKIPISEVSSILFRGYAGYGFASANHLGSINLYGVDSYQVENDVTGNYFAARIQSGLDFNLNPIIISLNVAYRIANSGELKGDLRDGNQFYENMGVLDARGNAIEFDYSGIALFGGLKFIL